MAALRVPTVAVVIGEGGSGGALAIGVADRVLMLENSVYSVISPEGCAAILWKSGGAREGGHRAQAHRAGPLRARVIDEVIPEPTGGAHSDWDRTAAALKEALIRHLGELRGSTRGAPRPPLGEVHGDGRVALRQLRNLRTSSRPALYRAQVLR
jgi:acetyl-CoA carboxylase carboxyl transferase subunit alpha